MIRGFHRTLVGHRDHAALDTPPQKFAPESLPGRIIERIFPTGGLRVNEREELSQRMEFDEAVEREGNDAAVFQDFCRRSDQGLQRNLLGLQSI